MPKNQFQRPLPVRQSHDVPRHGKPIPPPAKAKANPLVRPPEASLPPLAALLEKPQQK